MIKLVCDQCKNTFMTYPSKKDTKFCSRSCKHKAMLHKPEDFWENVSKTDPNVCWEWLGATNQRGYGHVKFNKKRYRAHRLSYELSVGPIGNDLLVCHKCDNRLCCNPSHLFLGTAQQNTQDGLSKGRPIGKHGKLTYKGRMINGKWYEPINGRN